MPSLIEQRRRVDRCRSGNLDHVNSLHIVWDWNGTLLADLPFVVEAVNRSISRYGVARISEDDYRDHYTRPVRLFYDALFERPVTDMEWVDLNKTFHDYYYAVVDGIGLAEGATHALARVASLGWTQSLLSMSTHDHLVETVRAHQIDHRFTRIAGLQKADGSQKAIHLKAHLAADRVDPQSVVVVGDTPDDHAAAMSVGAMPIVFDGGSHHRAVLEGLGSPIVDSLSEVVALIESRVRS